MSSIRRVAVLSIGLVAVVGAGGGGASGATTGKGVCVTSIDPVRSGERTSVTREIGCWATEAEANAGAGVVGAAPGLAAPVVQAASVTIGKDFTGQFASGTVKIWVTSNLAGCSGGAVYSAAMPAGFDNVTRSAYGFAGCNHNTHYDPPSASGTQISCNPNCPTMPGMDMRTSFVRWAP